MTEKVLDVKNLKIDFHTYAGDVKAIRNVSFHLNKGETLAIVGESGSGKSVTTRTMVERLIFTVKIYWQLKKRIGAKFGEMKYR